MNLIFSFLKQLLITVQQVIYIEIFISKFTLSDAVIFFTSASIIFIILNHVWEVNIWGTPFVWGVMASWHTENSSDGWIIKKWDKSICILYYEQLQHLHVVLSLVLGQHILLDPEDDFLAYWKELHWINHKKLRDKHMRLILWTTSTPTWCTPPSPWSTCPPGPWRWLPRFSKKIWLNSA